MMFEPELKYCPRCGDEYRAEIVKCHACGCELLPGAEMIARAQGLDEKKLVRLGELHADDELVAVRRGPLAEMKAYAELLNVERICSVLAGDDSSCGKGCCAANFDLLVRLAEAPDAVLIIEAEIRRTAVIEAVELGASDSVFDPLATDNTCPACGRRFSGGMACPDCGLCF
jgi:hypothetical protein